MLINAPRNKTTSKVSKTLAIGATAKITDVVGALLNLDKQTQSKRKQTTK